MILVKLFLKGIIMKRIIYIILILSALLLTSCVRTKLNYGDLKIDSWNFPDEIFREFVSENFDTDKNGGLSAEEIEAVTEISIVSKEVSSLEGVKIFTNLRCLECADNNLKSLDVSSNSNLVEPRRLACVSYGRLPAWNPRARTQGVLRPKDGARHDDRRRLRASLGA